MIFLFLATLIVLVHLGFILLVVFGGWIVWRRPRFAWVHVPVAIWGAWIELSGRLCPLTPLENRLRARAGVEGYSGDFLDHYLVSLIYPAGLTREIQTGLGAAVIALNVVVYIRVLRRWRRAARP